LNGPKVLTMPDRSSIKGNINRLTTERRTRVISALVEGASIRATCRITGTANGTVMTLLADAGAACLEYQDENLRNLPCRRIECDEIGHSFTPRLRTFLGPAVACTATATLDVDRTRRRH
jgi:hypothetical protein